VERVLDEVGLSALAQREAGTLSYGDIALLEIGIALAQEPRLLLLDEPICGMSPAETGRTVAKIRQLAARPDICIFQHDMRAVTVWARRPPCARSWAWCLGAPAR